MAAKKFIRNTPPLPVKDLRQTINYYRDTLGFTDEWVFGDLREFAFIDINGYYIRIAERVEEG